MRDLIQKILLEQSKKINEHIENQLRKLGVNINNIENYLIESKIVGNKTTYNVYKKEFVGAFGVEIDHSIKIDI